MNFRIIVTDFIMSMKNFIRSKGTVFFTLAFPVLLILLFGAIFSGGGEGTYTLHVKNYDYDNGELLATFLLNDSDLAYFLGNYTNFYDAVYYHLNNTNVIEISIINDDEALDDDDLWDYIESEKIKSVMVIPDNYGFKLGLAISQNDISHVDTITLLLDQSELQRNGVILSVISQFASQSNLLIADGDNFLNFNTTNIIQDDFSYIDFFLPGVIALTVMTNSVFGTIEMNTRFRKNGILRKLSTTPIKRGEWIFAKMLYMLFMAFLSTLVILLVGALVYGIAFKISIHMFFIIIFASCAFSGMGMIVSRYVTDEDTAAAAANILTFPQMFLAGIFVPFEQMPVLLVSVAKFLPLFYVAEGLRDSMIYADLSSAFVNTVFVFLIAVILFAIGIFVTKWRDD